MGHIMFKIEQCINKIDENHSNYSYGKENQPTNSNMINQKMCIA